MPSSSTKMFVFQREPFLRFDQVGEEDLGGIARQRAVVVDDERHRRGIADERLVAALAQILLAQFPFERLGQRAEILHDVARSLSALQHLLGNGQIGIEFDRFRGASGYCASGGSHAASPRLRKDRVLNLRWICEIL